jgi:acyl transferase domain-containing protein
LPASGRRFARRVHFLKAEISVLLRTLERLLKLARAVLHFLDHAGELADLAFEARHARNHFGVFVAALAEQLHQLNRERGVDARHRQLQRQCRRMARGQGKHE